MGYKEVCGMPTITKKQLEDYEKLCCDRSNGRILTPDGLRFVARPATLMQRLLESTCWKHWPSCR